MNANDLLEQRADRGSPRGSANVWAAAIHELDDETASNDRRSVWGLRVALATSAAVLMVLAGTRAGSFDRHDMVRATVPPAAEEAEATLPAPILITGMRLVGDGTVGRLAKVERGVLDRWCSSGGVDSGLCAF